jgi:hypothetical protein
MSGLSDVLHLENWSRLSAPDQEAASRVLADALLAAGTSLAFSGLRTLAPHMPDASAERPAERTIATFFDEKHELDWVLVPGGRLRAWGERERRLLRTAFEAMESFRLDQGEELDVTSIRPYGADTFVFERMFRPEVTLEPFLTTAMPLTSASPIPGLDRERSRLFPLSETPAVFSVHDDELPEILQPRGWRLPNARESEWMCGAGGSIFPWGDALPRWMYELREFDDEDDEAELLNGPPEDSFEFHFRTSYDSPRADWEAANGFGLIDALVASHWVLDGGLAWHGGTAETYPWQACGEWAGFITSAIVPEPTKPKPWSSHALRPVIGLR